MTEELTEKMDKLDKKLDAVMKDKKGFFARISEKRKEKVKKKLEEQKVQKEEKKEEKKPEEPVPEKKGLTHQIKELNEKIEELAPRKKKKESKVREFKLPFKTKSQLKKLAQKNKVQVILLGTNRNIEPMTAKIQDGFIVINGKYHQCTTDFIYLWRGKFPTIVLPEWDLKPIGTKDFYDAMESGGKADAQQIIIRAIELKESQMGGKKLGGKAWIWVGVLVVAAFYLLFGQSA